MSGKPHIFVLAGESSGDRLGAALMRSLREETGGTARFSGIGGEAMQAEGLDPLFPMRDLSVMGFAEVIPHLPRILNRLRMASDAAAAARPDALVTIDAQVFAAMLAKRVKQASPETALVHYVAPTVWAWKPWRAKALAQYLDRLMALFPFEPPFFERHGLVCDFVGHPLVERVARVPPDAGPRFRAEFGIAEDAPLLLVAPGSRMSEIRRLAAPFGEAVGRLAARKPGLETLVPVALPVADALREAIAQWPVRPHLLDPAGLGYEAAEQRKFAGFAAADVALAASGTVTLELAAMGVPVAVGYKMPRLNEFIARRMMTVDTGTLVNIILGEKLVPEFFQQECNGATLAEALEPLFGGPARDRQLEGFAWALANLSHGETPPSVRAARSVLRAVEDKARSGKV